LSWSCPSWEYPGEICPGIVKAKEKSPKFSCNKFNFFPKKIFVLQVSSSFFVCERKLLGFRVFGRGLAKEKNLFWTKSFRTIPGGTAPGQKFVPPLVVN